MSNSGYQLLTDWVAKRANHTHAAVEKWWTHVDSMACRKSAPRQQRHSHLNDIIWRAMKRAQIPSARASGPASAKRQTPRWHHNPAMVEGKAAGMGRHSPGHVCRRPCL